MTNTLAEMYVMQRYLQPDDLARAGLRAFDAWAATFGRTVTALELAPDGGSYRFGHPLRPLRQRPRTAHHVRPRRRRPHRRPTRPARPRPWPAAGPKPSSSPPRPVSKRYVADLVARAERVRAREVRPREDNMLKITGDGRKAALDLRLVGGDPDPDGGKIAAAADRIAAICAATSRNRYLDADGEAHPRPGGLQLVFCDLGTPSAPGGTPTTSSKPASSPAASTPSQVRFIHDAGNDKAKADLFAACRDGRVAVLVGSTEKMGVGTNVQTRAVALHHLDCPWRPADIEQREGRLLRQGNQNPEVADPPLRHRRLLRRVHVADRRTQSRLHPPSQPRRHRRPGHRRHRRPSPLLRRSQSPRHRQPPHHGTSRRRTRHRQTRNAWPEPTNANNTTWPTANTHAEEPGRRASTTKPTSSKPPCPGGSTPEPTASP